jgi:hypothetical protein
VPHVPKAGQSLAVDMDQIARSRPLVTLHRRSLLRYEKHEATQKRKRLSSRLLSRPRPKQLRALATLEQGALSRRMM